MAERAPLYAEVLGDRFANLPEAVRRFHGEGAGPHGWSFQGTMAVERGRSAAARLCGCILRLPAAGPAVKIALVLVQRPVGERWQRRFGGRLFCTDQWRTADGRLAERMGPIVLILALTADEQELRYELCEIRLVAAGIGFPLPLRRRLRLEATERPHGVGGRVATSVRVTLPGGGLLIRYDGYVTPA